MGADFPTPTYIHNHEAVLSAYGYWPAFHDAPLLALEYSPAPASRIDLVVHTYELTPELDAEGFFGSTKHHVVHFRFADIDDLELCNFDIPNELIEMLFSQRTDADSQRFRVELVSVLGGDCVARFSAGSGEVVTVTPSNRDEFESSPIAENARLRQLPPE